METLSKNRVLALQRSEALCPPTIGGLSSYSIKS